MGKSIIITDTDQIQHTHRIVLLDEEMITIELKSTLSSKLCPGTANSIPTNFNSLDDFIIT